MATRTARIFCKMTIMDMAYFIEASFFLVLAALLKTCAPMRWYAPWLGEHRTDAETPPVAVDLDRLLPVVSAINRAVKYSPVKCKCLVHALCSFMMLRVNGLPSDFYLGVDKNASRDVIAHAWIKSGQYFIAGQHGHRQYAVISVFSNRPDSGSSSR